MKKIACCGLDCSGCEAFIATQMDDDIKRAEVAKQWSKKYNTDIKPEQINCDGCRCEGKKFFFTENMCEIRKCCLDKALDNCDACVDYACKTLEPFFKIAPEMRETLDAMRK